MAHFGPGPVIRSMTGFFRTSFQRIVQAPTMEQFSTEFDVLFAQKATFVLNGAAVSRAAYADALLKQCIASGQGVSASVEIKQSVEVNSADLNISDISVRSDLYSRQR